MKLSIFKSNVFDNNILWFYNDHPGTRVGYEYYSCNDEPFFYSKAYSTINGMKGHELHQSYQQSLKIYHI